MTSLYIIWESGPSSFIWAMSWIKSEVTLHQFLSPFPYQKPVYNLLSNYHICRAHCDLGPTDTMLQPVRVLHKTCKIHACLIGNHTSDRKFLCVLMNYKWCTDKLWLDDWNKKKLEISMSLPAVLSTITKTDQLVINSIRSYCNFLLWIMEKSAQPNHAFRVAEYVSCLSGGLTVGVKISLQIYNYRFLS